MLLKKTSCTLEIEFWGTKIGLRYQNWHILKKKEMPVIRVCSNNSKKYFLSSKNGLKSDVHGVCSENVYSLED